MKYKDKLTYIYFSDKAGKVHTGATSKNSFTLLKFVFFFLVIFSGFSGYMLVNFYFENENLTIRLNNMRIEKKAVEKKYRDLFIKSSEQNNYMEMDEFKSGEEEMEVNIEDANENIAQVPSKKTEEVEKSDKEETIKQKQEKQIDLHDERKEKVTKNVKLENLKVLPLLDNNLIKISFSVAKADISTEKASGYVILVWKKSGAYFTFPKKVGFSEGKFLSYSKGENFIIRYRRPFILKIQEEIKLIDEMHLYICDDYGNIIIKERLNLS